MQDHAFLFNALERFQDLLISKRKIAFESLKDVIELLIAMLLLDCKVEPLN
jgi:hypothetical protein